MADDITLTVRVRDLARGDFANLRRRLQGMDNDVRRLAGSSNLASERANRLSRELRGVSGRLGEMQRTGRMANSEVQFMRRSMGLLGRELRSAMRAGELSRDEFNNLAGQLDDTRIGFDRLTRDVERHSAVAHRAHREEQRRQAEQRRAAQQAARAQREEEQRIQRLGRLQARAEREEAQRNERLLRQQQRADAARARMAANSHQRELNRLRQAVAGGNLNLRIRSDESGLQNLNDGLSRLRDNLRDARTDTASAGRNVRRLTADLDVLGNILSQSQRDGSIARRDFDLLSGSMGLLARQSLQAARSGEINRGSLRGIRREVDLLRARMQLMDSDGRRIDNLGARLVVLQHRMRGVGDDAGFMRRHLGGMGANAVGGIRMATRAVGMLQSALGFLKDHINISTRWMGILLAVVLLLGPAAQALGALLTVALGGAFVALGAYAMRGSKAVGDAFKDMKSTVGSTVRQAAGVLEKPLVAAMGQVGASIKGMKGELTQAFAATAPLVKDFVGAFMDLAKMSMPGIITALKDMGPVMEGFRTGMALIGKGIGDMFAAMTAGGGAEGLKNVWITLGNEIRNLLVNIGEFINFASQSESATLLMVGAFRLLSGILHIVEGGLAAMDQMLQSVIDTANGIWDAFAPLLSIAGLPGVDFEIPSMEEMLAAKAKLDEMKVAQNDAAAAAKNHATSISDLISKILELGEVNRTNLDSQSAQEQAIDDAEKDIGKYAGALDMVNGQLKGLGEDAGRKAYEMLSKIGQSTKKATEDAEAAKEPWDVVMSRWKTGYDKIVELGKSMKMTSEDAKALAEKILGIPPSKEISLKARVAQAKEEIQGVITAFENAPNAKSIEVKALTSDAIAQLKAFGYKVTTLPDGKTKVETRVGGAKANIELLEALLNSIDGKTVNTYTNHNVTTIQKTVRVGGGGTYSSKPAAMRDAAGGSVARRASGGAFQHFPGGGFVQGPGGPFSDSILASFPSGAMARVSDSEYVVKASSVRKYGLRFMNALNSGQLRVPGFKKGGPTKAQKAAKERAKKEREARNSAVGELTISHFGKMAGFKTTEFAGDLARPDALADLVGALNKWRNVIKKALHGSAESRLLKQLDRAGKALIGWEKKLSRVTKSLDKAKEKLDELKQQAKQTKESVKSGVLSATNITGAAQGDAPLTVAGLMARQRQSVDKAGAFSKALKDLQARGVSKTIIQQIAEAGIEGGGLETAGALLSASGSELASINAMQKQIDAFAAGAGNTAADALYGAGIKAAEGLVKGLTKQKKAIEKAMMDIAKSMEKAIKKALGIKSPSKVMEKVGEYTAQGFQAGVEKTHKTTSGWDSMLNVSRTGGTGGVHYGNGAQTIQIMIGNKVVDELVLDSNRRTVRSRGGNVQAIFNQKR